MKVLGPGGELRALVTVENVRFGKPLEQNAFVYTPGEGDLILRASDLSGPQSTPSQAGLEGRNAPPFALPSLSGGTVSLESLRGKHVLIDFWATWCPPCRIALPHIQKLSVERKDLTVITITTDPPEVARQFLANNGYTFATLIDQNQTASRS